MSKTKRKRKKPQPFAMKREERATIAAIAGMFDPLSAKERARVLCLLMASIGEMDAARTFADAYTDMDDEADALDPPAMIHWRTINCIGDDA